MTSTAIGTVLEGAQRNLKADQLILVNLSGMECHSWLATMRDAGQPWHEELADNLTKAKVLLQTQPQAHALVCYDAPEREVAGCIAMGRLPSQALANWLNANEALLDLYRDNFHRITLVKREAFGAHANELFGQLAVRSGIALGRVTVKPTESEVSPDPAEEQQKAIHRLLALQVLQHPSAQSLAQELEASTLPLCEPESLLDLVDEAYDVLQEGLSKRADISVEEYEALLQAKEKLTAENAEFLKRAQEQQKLQDEQASLQAKLKDVQEENDLVIEQLHKTQEELEQYLLSYKGSTKRIEKLERDMQQKSKQLTSQLEAAKQQLKELRSSKSWKLTAPMRKGMKILAGKKSGGA